MNSLPWALKISFLTASDIAEVERGIPGLGRERSAEKKNEF
jgi:hypothetical protein